jgi:Uri superfamily endonuclease
MTSISALPGAYAVQFSLPRARDLTVGKLGKFHFPAGEYFYLGSARGPGGLQTRIGRHLAGPPIKPHWHIDRLHAVARAQAYCYLLYQEVQFGLEPRGSVPSVECIWSQALAELPGAQIPVPGFGASDCHRGCRAHLVGFPPHHLFTVDPLDVKKCLARAIQLPIPAVCCARVT